MRYFNAIHATYNLLYRLAFMYCYHIIKFSKNYF